ncbi:RNA-binding domain-containing protein [Ileibacterium valens]|nr:RNA-binding domain-containing protein [Ileibacterium valens]
MNIPMNIEELLKGKIVESSRIELKENFNPDPMVHTICAFANDIDNIGGGYIFVGIKEVNGIPERPITGLPINKLDEIQKEVIRCCHFIEPLYIPEIQTVEIDEKPVLLIRVQGGHSRPYKACINVPKKKKDHLDKNGFENREKKYYIRKGSSTIVASPLDEKELYYISSSIPYDDRPNLLAIVEDLSLERMKEHLRQTGSSLLESNSELSLYELAEDLRIIEGPPEELRPLNVGLLMFGKDPQKFFRYARTELVWIPNPDGTGMEEQTFSGPLQVQLKNALDTIKDKFLKEKIIKLPDRPESMRIWNYPFQAVQEILANAIYHKSYQIHEPITVRITNEELEITSHPGFDRSIQDIDIEARRIRSRSYRNRRIGDFLKELHLIEGRNTGFPNAAKALKLNGSPEFKLIMDPERQFLSVVLPIHPVFQNDKGSKKNADYRNKILMLLEEHPDSKTQLALRMGYKGITSKLNREIKTLLLEKKIEQVLVNGKTVYKVA